MLATLQATLPSGLICELILVDDASTDGTRQWLIEFAGPSLRVMLNARNVDFAWSNHAVVAVARGDCHKTSLYGLVMLLKNQQLDAHCRIAEVAGHEVMDVYASDFSAWTMDDASPLTLANLCIDTVIRLRLKAVFPSIFILSEESVTAEQHFSETFFLVDSLGGIKELLKLNGEFTVNIAVVHQGQVVAGFVLAPALGELYYAASGLGAFKRVAFETAVLQVAEFDGTDPLRVIGSRFNGADALAAWLAVLPYEHRFVVAGSFLKFYCIANDNADIYPRFSLTSQWDTATAQCVLESAGGAVLDLTGNPLRYGLDRHVLNTTLCSDGR